MKKFVIGGCARREVDRRIILDLIPIEEIGSPDITFRSLILGREDHKRLRDSFPEMKTLEELEGNLFIWFGSGADPPFKIEEANYEVP